MPIGSSLDPKRVLILRVVAQCGSISAAARSLGWTPPAVSQHLAALERSIGTPLVRRHRSGVQLTEAGLLLVRRADVIVQQLDLAQEEIAALARRDHGTVRLGCFPSSLMGYVPAVLRRLQHQAGPQIEVLVTEANPTDSAALLRSGEIDLALVYDYVDASRPPTASGAPQVLHPASGDFTRVELGGDDVALILSSDHPAASRTDITLADLRDSHWIAGCDLCRDHLERSCSTAGFSPKIAHQTHNGHVIRALVAADTSGLTVGTTPTTTLSAFRGHDVTVRLVPDLPGRRFFADYRPGADETPAIRRVLDTLQQVGGTLNDDLAKVRSGLA
ncbi:MAG: LysR family transcriptional regulator [Propionibacteriaceae bacterium]|jgi:molybdate transport repressor ModE-like protein|nr:LysR family transcriptional regulator [Propionibacteriaceae bacterium]